MSECITKSERKKIEKQNKYAEKHGGAGGEQQENKPPVGVAALPDGRILTPYKRQPLDYLSVAVGVNKKKSRRRRNRGTGPDMDRLDSPVSTTPSSPRCGSSGKKGRTLYRPWNPNAAQQTSPASSSNLVSTSSPNGTATAEWNGTSMTIYNRSINSPTPSSQQQLRTPASGQSGAASTSFCSPVAANPTRPANHNRFADLADDTPVQFKPSTASHDLHKLKKLDLSYAEVLRRADHCKQRQRQHHHK